MKNLPKHIWLKCGDNRLTEADFRGGISDPTSHPIFEFQPADGVEIPCFAFADRRQNPGCPGLQKVVTSRREGWLRR